MNESIYDEDVVAAAWEAGAEGYYVLHNQLLKRVLIVPRFKGEREHELDDCWCVPRLVERADGGWEVLSHNRVQ